MGRPDQGNKARTPVGYSRDTGVSTGGPATAVPGVFARDTPGVYGLMWGQAASQRELRCMRCDAPWARYPGLRQQPADPGSGEVCIEDCTGVMVRWTVRWAYLGWRGDLGGAFMRGTRSCR